MLDFLWLWLQTIGWTAVAVIAVLGVWSIVVIARGMHETKQDASMGMLGIIFMVATFIVAAVLHIVGM